MDRQNLMENLLNSKAVLLSRSSIMRTVISNTATLLAEEESLEKSAPKHGGSRKGRAPNLRRDFEGGFQTLFRDYFAKDPVFPEEIFRRRFRMHRPLFLRIVDDIKAHNNYFVQKKDALGKPGLQPIQKITAAICMLAYGGAADAYNEYLRISESTTLESLTRFCTAVIEVYGEEYLRSPTPDDLKQILAINEERGFPGMCVDKRTTLPSPAPPGGAGRPSRQPVGRQGLRPASQQAWNLTDWPNR
jgi:hypothetical protein